MDLEGPSTVALLSLETGDVHNTFASPLSVEGPRSAALLSEKEDEPEADIAAPVYSLGKMLAISIAVPFVATSVWLAVTDACCNDHNTGVYANYGGSEWCSLLYDGVVGLALGGYLVLFFRHMSKGRKVGFFFLTSLIYSLISLGVSRLTSWSDTAKASSFFLSCLVLVLLKRATAQWSTGRLQEDVALFVSMAIPGIQLLYGIFFGAFFVHLSGSINQPQIGLLCAFYPLPIIAMKLVLGKVVGYHPELLHLEQVLGYASLTFAALPYRVLFVIASSSFTWSTYAVVLMVELVYKTLKYVLPVALLNRMGAERAHNKGYRVLEKLVAGPCELPNFYYQQSQDLLMACAMFLIVLLLRQVWGRGCFTVGSFVSQMPHSQYLRLISQLAVSALFEVGLVLVFPRIAKDMRLESAGVAIDTQQNNSQWEFGILQHESVLLVGILFTAYMTFFSWAAFTFGLVHI